MADMEWQRADELGRSFDTAPTAWESEQALNSMRACRYLAEEYERQASYYRSLAGY